MLFKDQIPHAGKLNILRRAVVFFGLTSGRYPFISSDSQGILLQVVHHSLPARCTTKCLLEVKENLKAKARCKRFSAKPSEHIIYISQIISLKPTKILFYQLSRSHRSNYSFIPNTCSLKKKRRCSSWSLWFQHFRTLQMCGFENKVRPAQRWSHSCWRSSPSWPQPTPDAKTHHSMICFGTFWSIPWIPCHDPQQLACIQKIHQGGDIHRYPSHPISTPLSFFSESLRAASNLLAPKIHPMFCWGYENFSLILSDPNSEFLR